VPGNTQDFGLTQPKSWVATPSSRHRHGFKSDRRHSGEHDTVTLLLNGSVQTSHASADHSHDEFLQILRGRQLVPNEASRPRCTANCSGHNWSSDAGISVSAARLRLRRRRCGGDAPADRTGFRRRPGPDRISEMRPPWTEVAPRPPGSRRCLPQH
jgi:hypothetical protein